MRTQMYRRSLLILAAGLTLVLLGGCAGGADPQSSASATASASPSSPASVGPALRDLLTTVRSELQVAYKRGRDGEPLPKSSQAVAALRRYVAARSPSNLDLVSSRASLLDALQLAYQRGRDLEPFESEPPTAADLQLYLDDHPDVANKASRVIVIASWGVGDTSATRQGAVALFWADGAKMWCAGSMAPGVNEEPFDMSRQSASGPWQFEIVSQPL